MIPSRLTDLLKVSWQDALLILGYKPVSMLPATVACPICQGPLIVYPDIQHTACFNCSGCSKSGTMVDLLKYAWGMDTDTYGAIRKFKALGGYVSVLESTMDRAKFYDTKFL